MVVGNVNHFRILFLRTVGKFRENKLQHFAAGAVIKEGF